MGFCWLASRLLHRHGGYAFILSSCPHWRMSHPAWQTAGGLSKYPTPGIFCCGEGQSKGSLHQLRGGEGHPPSCKSWKTGCYARRKAGDFVSQGPCLHPLTPSRSTRQSAERALGPPGARQAHRTFQEPSACSEQLHKWSLMQSGEITLN